MITKKQMAVLVEIQRHVNAHNYPPTVRELAAMLGKSLSTIHDQMRHLKRLGYITWESERPRTIRVLQRSDEHAG